MVISPMPLPRLACSLVNDEAAAPRIGILVVAYNAEHHLSQDARPDPGGVLRPGRPRSSCATTRARTTPTVWASPTRNAPGHRPIKVVKHPINLGYGGNQKYGYRWAIEEGLDIVVMLHADGQYAPECLPEMVAPIVAGEADAVFGSRMMESGAAHRRRHAPLQVRRQPHPEHLAERHGRHRADRVAQRLPGLLGRGRSRPSRSTQNSDGFDFDTEIIVQLIESGARIAEIPIPTYYGDEICHVNGLEYAWDVSKLVGRYRLHKMGFGSGELAFSSEPYEIKPGPGSSHGRLLSWLANRRPAKVLDLGCGDGSLGQRIRTLGHHVTGVDVDTLRRRRGATRRLHPGRPRTRHPRLGRQRLRHRVVRRRDRARPRPAPVAARRRHSSWPPAVR